jgi:Protein of unknown function (DUF1579)
MTGTDSDTQQAGPPQPDPALRRLDPLVGTWTMRGHFVGSDEENITGEATFQWLEGGFFLQQDTRIDFAGTFQVRSRELIGYDPDTQGFTSHVFSNLSPTPLPYAWDLRDGMLTIAVSYGPLDASFMGKFSDDGNSFSGGWRPNPGADETINIPYDIGGSRIS